MQSHRLRGSFVASGATIPETTNAPFSQGRVFRAKSPRLKALQIQYGDHILP